MSLVLKTLKTWKGGALPSHLSPALGSGKARPRVLETVQVVGGSLCVNMTAR